MKNFLSRLYRDFPFLSTNHALLLLRVVTAGLFMAHAITRIIVGTIPLFGQAMEAKGFPGGVHWVWGITIAEIVAGSLMIIGWQVRWAALTLFSVAAGGIALIHWKLGWFVGEFNTGGSEYSVALIFMLLMIAAADRERSGREVA
jgi:putative oxidoreductase